MTATELRAPTPPAPVAPDWPAARTTLPLMPRFTLDGDEALERHLARTCARVLSGVRGLIPSGKLEALFLGGGYGRGEGGVLHDAAGDHPYNDLEFYVAIRGNRHANEFFYRHRLEVLGEILTQLAEVEVEFKIMSLAELAASPVSMFSYDLVQGHRQIGADLAPKLLAGCAQHRRAEDIPALEATRLLMNRCTGLLLARTQLEADSFSPAATDFVRRNVAKAQLACGDALLTADGLYHWSCRERHHRLQALVERDQSPWHITLLRHHAAGVEFKLHPKSGEISRESLVASHAAITAFALECWLRLETRRLGRPFFSARAYAEDPGDQCPGTSALRNFLLNLRVNRLRLRARPNPWRHPRQRIFRSLALLLWEPAALTDPGLQSRLRAELNTHATIATGWMAAYQSLWRRVR